MNNLLVNLVYLVVSKPNLCFTRGWLLVCGAAARWASSLSACFASSLRGVLGWASSLTDNPGQVVLKVLKKKLNLPGHLGPHTHSLLKGLLARDPDRRLGCHGTLEVDGMHDRDSSDARDPAPDCSWLPRRPRGVNGAGVSG